MPVPGPGEVQIRVKALGLNRAEAMLRATPISRNATLPSGLGLEAAGIVETVGDGVEGFAPGDAVSIVPPQSMVRWPAYGELATFPPRMWSSIRHSSVGKRQPPYGCNISLPMAR